MPHVDVDRPRLAILGAAPERLQQHLAGVDAAGVRGERPQQLELDIGELNRLVVDLDVPPAEVDPQAVDLDCLLVLSGCGGGRASQECPDPASELPDREWLRDVVVGAELQADHLVELVVAGGQHDDRHGAGGAKALAHLEPVQLREHQVEDDEIDVLLGEAVECLLPVTRLNHREPVSFERVREELLNGVLVVDEQDGGGVGHRQRLPAHVVLRPTIASVWRRSRPVPRGDARAQARSSARSADVSTAAHGCSWIPLLAAAFSVHKVEPLPAPQDVLPASFDRFAAVEVASQLAHLYPDRMPGTAGAAGAADFVRQQLAPYGLKVVSDRFRADLPGHGEQTLENQTVTVPGRSPDEIVVMAHRDDDGTGPGANDNASGIAALIQLARSYGSPEGSRPVSPLHTLVFVATDGGAFGALGAKRFAERHRGKVVAALDLTALASRGPPRVVLAGTEPRLASPGLVETAAERVLEQAGRRPAHPGWLGQLIDLAFPFTLYEQGPLLAHGLPALTLTSGSERPPASFPDQPSRLNGVRLAQLGRAAQQTLRWFDSGAELAPGTAAYVYFGPRVLPGWAIELVLIAALVPFMVATVDLFRAAGGGTSNSHRPCGATAAGSASGSGSLSCSSSSRCLASGLRPHPCRCLSTQPPPRTGRFSPSSDSWSSRARLAGRPRPTRPAESGDGVRGAGGTTAALLSLGVIALLVLATNPFALVFLLPSLNAWLWLPHYRSRPLWARAALLAAGFLGPLLLLGSLGLRYDLGLDAPWYLAELTAAGYVKLPADVMPSAGWRRPARSPLSPPAGMRRIPAPRNDPSGASAGSNSASRAYS